MNSVVVIMCKAVGVFCNNSPVQSACIEWMETTECKYVLNDAKIDF